jgi:hypothetical protein
LKKKLLIIEDDEKSLLMIQKFNSDKYEIETVSTISEVRRLFNGKVHFDVVITDLGLPFGDVREQANFLKIYNAEKAWIFLQEVYQDDLANPDSLKGGTPAYGIYRWPNGEKKELIAYDSKFNFHNAAGILVKKMYPDSYIFTSWDHAGPSLIALGTTGMISKELFKEIYNPNYPNLWKGLFPEWKLLVDKKGEEYTNSLTKIFSHISKSE